jgi:starch-binding outer membrane protein, SusD/RagB family
MKKISVLVTVAALAFAACDFNITDPNNPLEIGPNPSRSQVGAAVAGIIIAARSDAADWALDAGIIGREAYRFDGSDPRFITELLAGPLDPGGGAFGGDHWFEHYAAIRSANSLLNVIGTASALSAAEQNATQGVTETLKAYSFLMVLNGHTEDSIPVAVNQAVTEPPAPFVSNDSAFRYVTGLLDSADAHLAAAGSSAIPFALPSGFTGFTTPATFRRFNRALKARVEVYRGSRGCAACYTTALTALAASFIDTSATADLNAGVYFNYSTNPGDAPNPLFQNPQTGENFVHPSIQDSVETKSGGGNDNRYTAKVVDRTLTSAGVPPLSSDLGWIRYGSSAAPLPIIRNEELILLRAEANNATTNPIGAAADANYIRVKSGGLAAIAGLAGQTQAQILNEILRQRKYSLLYEGHRWVDMRRTGHLGNILIDRTGDQVFATLPIPQSEVQARQ